MTTLLIYNRVNVVSSWENKGHNPIKTIDVLTNHLSFSLVWVSEYFNYLIPLSKIVTHMKYNQLKNLISYDYK